MNNIPAWIAVDWGTSNLRVWGVDANGSPLFERESAEGMGRLVPGDYPGVLNRLLNDVPVASGLDVVICGMAGAKQGWREAPYLETPATPEDLARNAVRPPAGDNGLNPYILPGVCQRTPGHEDVMRGEETQILGLLALKPGFAGTICMPGTHAKWVQIEDGRIARFETSMTGEIFEVMRQHSVLHHSMPEDLTGEDTEDGLAEGLERGLAQPERLGSLLFRTRSAALLAGKSPHWCAGYLSGLLVGADVGGHKNWIDGVMIPLIGSARLCRIYGNAFSRIGVKTETIEASAAVLAGLSAARKQLQ